MLRCAIDHASADLGEYETMGFADGNFNWIRTGTGSPKTRRPAWSNPARMFTSNCFFYHPYDADTFRPRIAEMCRSALGARGTVSRTSRRQPGRHAAAGGQLETNSAEEKKLVGTDRLTVILAAEALVRKHIDVGTQEMHGSVGEQELCPPDVRRAKAPAPAPRLRICARRVRDLRSRRPDAGVVGIDRYARPGVRISRTVHTPHSVTSVIVTRGENLADMNRVRCAIGDHGHIN